MRLRERLGVYSSSSAVFVCLLLRQMGPPELMEKVWHADQTLKDQAWLLGLKPPATRPRENLANFIAANGMEMSEADAKFISEEHRSDLVALARDEKELMGVLLGKYFYKLFETKVWICMLELRYLDIAC